MPPAQPYCTLRCRMGSCRADAGRWRGCVGPAAQTAGVAGPTHWRSIPPTPALTGVPPSVRLGRFVLVKSWGEFMNTTAKAVLAAAGILVCGYAIAQEATFKKRGASAAVQKRDSA